MARPEIVPLTRKAKVLIDSAVFGNDNRSKEDKKKKNQNDEDDDDDMEDDEHGNTVTLDKRMHPRVSTTATNRINKRIGIAVANKSKYASELEPTNTNNGSANILRPASSQWDDETAVDGHQDDEDMSSTISFKTVPEAASADPSDSVATMTDSIHEDDNLKDEEEEEGEEGDEEKKITSSHTDHARADDDDDDNFEYQISNLLSWRYTGTESQTCPATVDSDSIPTIELQVQWVGFPNTKDYTWEDEAELQRTAPESVFLFWERCIAAGDAVTKKTKKRPRGIVLLPRSVVLGIQDDTQGVPLRIVDHRRVNSPAARFKSRRGRGCGRGRGRGGGEGGGSISSRGGGFLYEFKVEWVGYRDNTWEPAGSLAQGLLEEYWQSTDSIPA